MALLLLTAAGSANAALHAYPAASTGLTTDTYRVEVSQRAGTQPRQLAAVYTSQSNNRCAGGADYGCDPGRAVSWAGFAFSGGEATVTVVRAAGWGGSVRLRPASYGLVAHTIPGNDTAVYITVPASPLARHVSVEGPAQVTGGVVTDALLIFADPPEDPARVPSGPSPSVWYYAPGVWDLGGQKPVPAEVKQIYLAPGAWVDGGFVTSDPSCSVQITGRGVISGRNYPFLPQSAGQECFYNGSFCWGLLNLDKGAGHLVEGVVLSDPPKYYYRSYAGEQQIRNVKMVSGWKYNTDGIVTGNGGIVENTFVRANDDSVKLYKSGMVLRDLVIWQQKNGGVFQLGWWTTHDQRDILVDGVDVIHTEWGGKGVNDGVFDLVVQQPAHNYSVQNITWRNVRVEAEASPQQLISISMEKASGYIYGFKFENVSFGGQLPTSTISAYTGQARGFTFKNLSGGGSCIADLASSKISGVGDDADFQFSCPGS